MRTGGSCVKRAAGTAAGILGVKISIRIRIRGNVAGSTIIGCDTCCTTACGISVERAAVMGAVGAGGINITGEWARARGVFVTGCIARSAISIEGAAGIGTVGGTITCSRYICAC